MKDEKDYIQKLTEIRSMMEQSSKFLSLSGWAGIMAGIYALIGTYIGYHFLDYNFYEIPIASPFGIYILALAVLGLAISTAIFCSYRKALKNKRKLWNYTTRKLIIDMMVPLSTGSIFILMLINLDFDRFVVPASLIFYGLALYNAGKFTLNEVKILGLFQVCLGLLSVYFYQNSLLWWSLGFGVAHIVYGIYMHFKYER